MTQIRFRLLLGFFALAALTATLLAPHSALKAGAQQPTGSVPTVTGTAAGPFITVNIDQEFVNVRSGPSSFFYPKIGILFQGQSAPALGRSPGGDWIQIYFVGVPGNIGWVYSANVSLNAPTLLPIVEPPPTPSLDAPTLDPTLVSLYIPAVTATRLATFTPAPPVEPPIFTDVTLSATRIPMGLLIFGFGFVGFLVAAISFLRGR